MSSVEVKSESYNSGRARALAVIGLLGAGLALDFVLLILHGLRIGALSSMEAQAEFYNESDSLVVSLENQLGAIRSLLFIATAVVFLLWLYRVYSNLRVFGRQRSD